MFIWTGHFSTVNVTVPELAEKMENLKSHRRRAVIANATKALGSDLPFCTKSPSLAWWHDSCVAGRSIGGTVAWAAWCRIRTESCPSSSACPRPSERTRRKSIRSWTRARRRALGSAHANRRRRATCAWVQTSRRRPPRSDRAAVFQATGRWAIWRRIA